MSDFDYTCKVCGATATETKKELPDNWWNLEARSGAPVYELLSSYACSAACLATFMFAVAVMYGKNTNSDLSGLVDVIERLDQDEEGLCS